MLIEELANSSQQWEVRLTAGVLKGTISDHINDANGMPKMIQIDAGDLVYDVPWSSIIHARKI